MRGPKIAIFVAVATVVVFAFIAPLIYPEGTDFGRVGEAFGKLFFFAMVGIGIWALMIHEKNKKK